MWSWCCHLNTFNVRWIHLWTRALFQKFFSYLGMGLHRRETVKSLKPRTLEYLNIQSISFFKELVPTLSSHDLVLHLVPLYILLIFPFFVCVSGSGRILRFVHCPCTRKLLVVFFSGDTQRYPKCPVPFSSGYIYIYISFVDPFRGTVHVSWLRAMQ